MVFVSYPKFIARVLCGFNKKGIHKHVDIVCSAKRLYSKPPPPPRSGKKKKSKKKSRRKKKKRRTQQEPPSHETSALLGVTANTVLLSDDDEVPPEEVEDNYDLMSHTSHALHMALLKATHYAKGLEQDQTMQYGPFDRKNKGVRTIDVNTLPKPIPSMFRYRFSRTPVLT